MHKRFFLTFYWSLLLVSCNTIEPEYPKATSGITWIDMETANTIENKEGKLFVVDLYTDWCGWCKVMDKKTFTDPSVIKYLDKNFHAIKFNAEQKETVTFDGRRYNWIKSGRNGINTLAKEWLGRTLSYPSYVFLNQDKKPIKVTRGYMPPEKFIEELETIIRYNKKKS